MSQPDDSKSFLRCCVVVALAVSACIAEGTPCTLDHRPAYCACSDKNLTCTKWVQLQKMPPATVSLKIVGTNQQNVAFRNSGVVNLPNLTSLDLSNNNVVNIEQGSFSRSIFPALQQLILNNNQLTLNGGAGIFDDVSQDIRELSLDGALDSNQTIIGANLYDIFNNSKLTNLETLRLDNNNIQFLFSFASFRESMFLKLKHLGFHNTNLIAIGNGTFTASTFPQLTSLDLSGNFLVNIDKRTIKDFKTFTHLLIDLGDNKFFCNCKLKDFQKWLNDTNLVQNASKLMCDDAVDIDSRHQPIITATLRCAPPLEDLNIEEELTSSYIVLGVILAIVGLLALIILFLRRNDIKNYFVDIYTTTKEAFTNHHHGYGDINRVRRDTPEMTPTEV